VKSFRVVDPNHHILICTHWSTVYNVRNQKINGKKFYFVQDFEPMFEPVNSQYVKALSTYSMGFNVICFGNWIANKIESDFGITAKRIPFTLDHKNYSADARPKTVDVLLFARPSQPRRCFELAVEALKILYKQNRSIRIGLYGEEAYGELGFPYHNFGLIKDQARLADIYRASRVGICLSPTNPSLVGYEMLACGLPLVDIKVPGWEANFGGDAVVYYALPTPEDVADTLVTALDEKEEYNKKREAGLALARAMPSDDAIGTAMLEIVSQ
jgi:glycosyltransferase involved in cell wall biosynthesis